MNNDGIIIIEDNSTMRLGIEETLRREGYNTISFDNGLSALNHFKKHPAELAIIDLKMEPMNGIEVLEKIKALNLQAEVLMISAYGTVDDAVKAMHLGAADFMTKPFSPDELRMRVKNIFEKISNSKKIETLVEQNKLLETELFEGFEEIIGKSSSMQKIFLLIDQISQKESTVLINGESGTGKELVARAIHSKSNRSENPFIKINCGALNDNLLESELFGHEKGAFTGAIKQKKGRFELADKGTLFLDEIGDVSGAMQVKLLRVIQEGEFERVGGEQTIKTSVRIIAATNKNLGKLITEGKFREDLYYRLSVILLSIPSLRERKDDIPLLVEHFLKKSAVKNGVEQKVVDQESINLLKEYSWPGNIRELENLVERLTVISEGKVIDSELIARHLFSGIGMANSFENLPLEEALYNFEKSLIVQAMKKSDGVKNRAAKMLGIGTSVLYYKLEKFGLM
ncbi:MAG: Fis family transcriptional regulator [Ignavibacteria bacterium RIFOXYB2_FULL_35_12]|nr:MAG: Fis family transcriptional regulator [Ignavibacteria bacterium GWA2_36_19]OGU49341.1 MAG: Fis family transcriptional regulator [Ignavibacteria bacterium GWC2_35_8]OGU61270.1 MAG: Fis family transcriptional regulator [Ignavibacteria bacterium GWF2_35_20]OGU83216.1 MAG: Fis family transcriptional regulator [Ignavibacteria bacterium RBG_16_35_7]OGU84106.1 MAG: Fis family transcriptional regulator [Ignavibacteria bacterium RIFOXYA12_FULL_35_25]OGU92246.1 MAG: Fis family transcriptional reg